MPHILHNKYSPKLDLLALKCMPILHDIFDWAEIFTTEIRFESKSNSTTFVENELWMKEIRHVRVAVIQNVKFRYAAPLGIKLKFQFSKKSYDLETL